MSEPSTNIHPVEAIEPDLSENLLGESARAFRRVWMWCARPNSPREIGVRHITVAWGLGQRPDLHSFADVGRVCGVTRAEISKIGTEFSRTFNVKFQAQNSLENRDKCRRNRRNQNSAK